MTGEQAAIAEYVLHYGPASRVESAWCEWSGRRFEARSSHGALCALARVLVAAGAPDGPWRSLTMAGTLSLFGPSLHKLAKLKVSEPDRGKIEIIPEWKNSAEDDRPRFVPRAIPEQEGRRRRQKGGDHVLTDDQLAAVNVVAVASGATAHPVFDDRWRVCEVAIWERGEWVGSVRLGLHGRLEAWSSIGDRWWKARDMEHAVAVALNGQQNRGFSTRISTEIPAEGVEGYDDTPEPDRPKFPTPEAVAA